MNNKQKPAKIRQAEARMHEASQGILIGAGLGLLAGLLVLFYPPWYAETHWSVLLTMTTMIGAAIGAIEMAMLGISLDTTDVKRYRPHVDEGTLMLLTVPQDRCGERCRWTEKSLAQNPLANKDAYARLPMHRAMRNGAEHDRAEWESISRLFS
jgi:hypothetical protein